jgi:hypothetical protein
LEHELLIAPRSAEFQNNPFCVPLTANWSRRRSNAERRLRAHRVRRGLMTERERSCGSLAKPIADSLFMAASVR